VRSKITSLNGSSEVVWKEFNICVNSIAVPTMKPSNQKLSSKVNSDALSPENAFTKRKKRHPDDSTHHTVAMVIIYRSLGHLLPENYDPDRRSLR